MRALAFVLMALALAGCDKFTGAADQKIADAEAIGFACRVSQKQPEACMKENEAQSPSSILDGWKSADEEIKAGKLNPNLGSAGAPAADIAAAPESDKPAEGDAKKDKPAEGEMKKDETKEGKDKTHG